LNGTVAGEMLLYTSFKMSLYFGVHRLATSSSILVLPRGIR